MDVFLSWSGEKSQKAAAIIQKWLPSILQEVKTFYSSDDIEKGSRGLSVIAEYLAKCQMGIIFITPDNINAPWINYEAGALSKSLEESRICTFLIGMEVKDIPSTSPLKQYQATSPTKSDFLKLLVTINKKLQEPLPQSVFEQTFDAVWPKFEPDLKDLSKSSTTAISAKKSIQVDSTTASDNISEILEILRVDYKRMIKDIDSKIDGIKGIGTERESFLTKEGRWSIHEKDVQFLLEFIASFKRDENCSIIEQVAILKEKISNALFSLGSTSTELTKRDNSPTGLRNTLTLIVRIKSKFPIEFGTVEMLFRTANIDGFIKIIEQ